MKKSIWLLLAAALAWGCGGNVKSEGDGDTDPEPDAGDMVGDTEHDAEEDTEEDVTTDTETDTPTDTPTDGGCTDGATRCSSDHEALETCVSGAWTSEDCVFDCSDTPDPHCRLWAISNIPDSDLLSLGEDYCGDPLPSDSDSVYEMRMDSDTGQIDVYVYADGAWVHEMQVRPADRGLNPDSCIGFNVVDQGTDEPQLGVFSYQEFVVPENYVATVYGTLPMVILSEDAALIEGGVYVGCNWEESDAFGGAVHSDEGAGAGGEGDSVAAGSGYRDGGGGGGAFGGAGGTGGGYETTIRGVGGTTYGTDELIPLLAGSGGGRGGGDSDPRRGRWGGRSGGALEIVSGDTITITGWVDASGCGGRNGSGNEGGGGGGSGGGIILEAPALVITGEVTVNGGGGAAGGDYGDSEPGEDGHIGETNPALGGTTTSSYACNGGDGNTGADPDGSDAEGCDVEDNDYNGGGGGGGSGRIRLNGMSRIFTDALFSPELTTAVVTEADLILE